ncbi:MAG: hypothetical protein H6821_13545 [Planctomycetaceae bacterium]|nr:hypothetical protein [Planctomycetales bacterium]MCB9875195.1 hypothetical protein [Planctomycetaceae bacterium]
MNSLPIQATNRLCHLAIAGAFCALLTGCRNDPHFNAHIEVLNAERRALEDQLYELEYNYERKVAELEEAKKKLKEISGDDPQPRRTNQSSQSPRIDLPESDDDFLDLSPPSVTPGVPDSPRIELPAPNSSGRSRPRNESTEPVGIGPTLLEPDDPRITHLHIDPLHTGGSDFDHKPGDDGIMVVVEPRNRSDAFVPLAGPLTVVVLDYAKRDAGSEARIAKWDLTAQQVDRSLHNNPSQRGIYLRLPWSDQPPESNKLMVAVRYTTADGRKIEATRDIFVTLPGQLSQRWTPRSSSGVETENQRSPINIARQPSANDGASVDSTPPRSEPTAGLIAPVSHETSEPQTATTPPSPTWRPYR